MLCSEYRLSFLGNNISEKYTQRYIEEHVVKNYPMSNWYDHIKTRGVKLLSENSDVYSHVLSYPDEDKREALQFLRRTRHIKSYNNMMALLERELGYKATERHIIIQTIIDILNLLL